MRDKSENLRLKLAVNLFYMLYIHRNKMGMPGGKKIITCCHSANQKATERNQWKSKR